MEVSGVLGGGGGGGGRGSITLNLDLNRPRRRQRGVSLLFRSSNSELCDKARLRYYDRNSHVVAASTKSLDKEKKKKKKKTKKEKSVVDGLSTENKLKLLKLFSTSADPLSEEDAADLFLKRFEQLRAEEEQQKERSKLQSRQPGKQVEVCMGNKCKKSGGAALLAELERQMGTDTATATVVSCKCMGKCKSAPNVRLTFPTPNPLYIGVGLQDITSIVAAFSEQDGPNTLL